jgi:hypothetical protein
MESRQRSSAALDALGMLIAPLGLTLDDAGGRVKILGRSARYDSQKPSSGSDWS